MIDLHLHSTASDGTLSPAELVEKAKECGLTAAALTDHDTLLGLPEAIEKGKELGLEIIPGIEMSAVWHGTEIHLLGYFADPHSSSLSEAVSYFQKKRDERNEMILDNLADDGIVITREELQGGDPDTVITRAHFARVLEERGLVRDTKDAFSRYLAYGGRYVPPKEGITPEMIMSVFRENHIFSSLAHPFQYKLSESELDQLIHELMALGLDGIEVWHSSHHTQEVSRLQALARMLHLTPTGGTDFHGDRKPGLMIGSGYGSMNVRDYVLNDMKKAYAAKYSS